MNIAKYFLKKGLLLDPKIINNFKDIVFLDEKERFSDSLFLDGLSYKDIIEDRTQVKDIEDEIYINEISNDVKRHDEKEDITDIDVPINISDRSNIKILKCYHDNARRREVKDFILYIKQRLNFLKNILLSREELQNTLSISKILDKKSRENVSIIGIVKNKRINKTGSITLTIEDLTGEVDILFNKNIEILDEIRDVMLDEVVGITGIVGDKIVFGNKLFFPDIPVTNEFKKYHKEEYIVFTSDVHVGNKFFYEKNFSNFIKWLNLEYGNENQKEIAKKVKYVFFVGDLCDGIGVYPDQEDDLVIKDIYEQYELFAKYINTIRKDITIILICGNHDAVRLSEPQPIIDKKIAPSLFENDNVIFTTNPSIVNICSTENFPGFNILLYHGYSFPFYSEEVDSIRKKGRLERVDLIMRYLIQRRHLAPSHGSNLYIPDPDEDHMLIDKIPDFFVSGHIHKTNASTYKGITLLNCGCWIGQTEDQEKRGIVPDPNRIMVVNLQTRDIKILNFEE